MKIKILKEFNTTILDSYSGNNNAKLKRTFKKGEIVWVNDKAAKKIIKEKNAKRID